MNRDGFINEIANSLGIVPNSLESPITFNSRSLYSAAAKNALVSLWDHEETDFMNDSISIVHFKDRLIQFIEVVSSLSPNSYETLVREDPSIIADHISKVYMKTGHVYHSQYRFYPVMYKSCLYQSIRLYRGSSPGSYYYMSGAGEYEMTEEYSRSPNDMIQMFRLDSESPANWFDKIIASALWKDSSLPSEAEYLNVRSALKGGYFTKSPDYTVPISLLRFGAKGEEVYCLYRKQENKFQIFQLPHYMTHTAEGRTDYNRIMIAVLMKAGKLPKLYASIHTNTVTVKLGVLLPYNTQNFYRLYSWPLLDSADNLIKASWFKREMAKPIYFIFKDYLQSLGYQFKEVSDG